MKIVIFTVQHHFLAQKKKINSLKVTFFKYVKKERFGFKISLDKDPDNVNQLNYDFFFLNRWELLIRHGTKIFLLKMK